MKHGLDLILNCLECQLSVIFLIFCIKWKCNIVINKVSLGVVLKAQGYLGILNHSALFWEKTGS